MFYNFTLSNFDRGRIVGFNCGVIKAKEEFDRWKDIFEKELQTKVLKEFPEHFKMQLKVVDRGYLSPVDFHGGQIITALSGEIVSYELPTLSMAIILEPVNKRIMMHEIKETK
jgi:hypothetical protein